MGEAVGGISGNMIYREFWGSGDIYLVGGLWMDGWGTKLRNAFVVEGRDLRYGVICYVRGKSSALLIGLPFKSLEDNRINCKLYNKTI